MNSIVTRIGMLSVVVAVLCLPLSSSGGGDPAVERIQNAYQGIRDVKGSFIQKSLIKDLERTDTFKGSFMIKMPAKMRWHYRGDEKETEVVINGEELIIYQKKEKQAFKGRFDRQTYGQAPIALLGGFGSIEKEFEVMKKGEKILLKPKREMGTVVSIEVTPSDGEFPIAAMTIIDKRSNRIDITLKDVHVNSGINDGAFDFSLPKGASTFDYK
ncbi:MAG TPA: outer membrane lipoprotein carrier protein LolA [Thermodesulfovibrionales bacterium]|nr:outer membrane lipoprotein carrier protein LolA [Thermodesulfovibrionales bacterium]